MLLLKCWSGFSRDAVAEMLERLQPRLLAKLQQRSRLKPLLHMPDFGDRG